MRWAPARVRTRNVTLATPGRRAPDGVRLLFTWRRSGASPGLPSVLGRRWARTALPDTIRLKGNLVKLQRSSRLAALLAAGSLALTACGGSDDSGRRRQPPRASGLSGTLAGAGASSQDAAMQGWIAGFQTANPERHHQLRPGRLRWRSRAVPGRRRRLRRLRRRARRRGARPGRGALRRRRLVEVPLYISPIAVAFNLPGVETLNLTPATIAGIFTQKITKWNAPEIAADNPDAELPRPGHHAGQPRRRLGHDRELHRVPRRRGARRLDRGARRRVAGRRRRGGTGHLRRHPGDHRRRGRHRLRRRQPGRRARHRRRRRRRGVRRVLAGGGCGRRRGVAPRRGPSRGQPGPRAGPRHDRVGQLPDRAGRATRWPARPTRTPPRASSCAASSSYIAARRARRPLRRRPARRRSPTPCAPTRWRQIEQIGA